MARLFYVHWNKAEALKTVRELRAMGHVVRYEHEDGAKAWQLIKSNPPDALVISLERLPSHGRRVAAVTQQFKKLRELPVLFVGGEPQKVRLARKQFSKARFCGFEALGDVLEE